MHKITGMNAAKLLQPPIGRLFFAAFFCKFREHFGAFVRLYQ